MAQPCCRLRPVLLLALLATINLSASAQEVPVVWTGPTLTFTKMGANPGESRSHDCQRLADARQLARHDQH
jgi:hypothetical protein